MRQYVFSYLVSYFPCNISKVSEYSSSAWMNKRHNIVHDILTQSKITWFLLADSEVNSLLSKPTILLQSLDTKQWYIILWQSTCAVQLIAFGPTEQATIKIIKDWMKPIKPSWSRYLNNIFLGMRTVLTGILIEICNISLLEAITQLLRASSLLVPISSVRRPKGDSCRFVSDSLGRPEDTARSKLSWRCYVRWIVVLFIHWP
jgi:hypothetical protein